MVMISLAKSRAALVAGSVAIGTMFFAAGSFVTSPALAQEPIKVASTVNANTDCSKYEEPGVILADTKCEILKGKALDKEIDARQVINGCLLRIQSALDRGITTKAQLRKSGLTRKENACVVLDKLKLG